MTVGIEDFVSVADRVAQLGCTVPRRIAILPENLQSATDRSKLLYGSEAATIRKLFRDANFALDELLPTGERVPAIHNKHFEWSPFLFISAALLSHDPHAVSIALGIISNYATDFFKGMPGKKVKLTVIVEKKKDKSCKKLSYEGNVAGLASLADIVR